MWRHKIAKGNTAKREGAVTLAVLRISNESNSAVVNKLVL